MRHVNWCQTSKLITNPVGSCAAGSFCDRWLDYQDFLKIHFTQLTHKQERFMVFGRKVCILQYMPPAPWVMPIFLMGIDHIAWLGTPQRSRIKRPGIILCSVAAGSWTSRNVTIYFSKCILLSWRPVFEKFGVSEGVTCTGQWSPLACSMYLCGVLCKLGPPGACTYRFCEP